MKTEIKALESSLERTVHEYNEVQLQLRLYEESRYTNRSDYSETAKLLRESRLTQLFIFFHPLRRSTYKPLEIIKKDGGLSLFPIIL